VLAVNLKSAFFGAQPAAQQFVAQRSGGLIVTISSTHEDPSMPGNIAYCVSKGAPRCSPARQASNWDRSGSSPSTSRRQR
jgi:NADP-dependent 3-hydroxy acid dehydrogenase YdfG